MEILGIGECMVEFDAEASLTESVHFLRQTGGDVFNTLVASSKLGCKVGFCTRVAHDPFGQILLKAFDDYNIDTRYVFEQRNGYNGVYFSGLTESGGHEFLYYRRDSAASQLMPEHITPQMIRDTKIIYATGITQALSNNCRQAVLKAFKMAKQQRVTVAYDLNFREQLWEHKKNEALQAMVEVLPYIDIIFLTMEDARSVLKIYDVEHILEYFHLRDVKLVALKQGENGVSLSLRKNLMKIPTRKVTNVQDTVGAGDAFNAGFMVGLILGESLENCARIGNIVASYSLTERGPIAGLPDWHDVEAQLAANRVPAATA